jgi:hypothetical protein
MGSRPKTGSAGPLPAPPPTMVDPSILEAYRAERARQTGTGRRASILTSGRGAAGKPAVARPSLLGGRY